MRAAFRGQRDPGWGRDKNEPRILVERVIERIEPAFDERVVDRPDRQQAGAEQRAGKPERRQLKE